jgi:hypothetical protein
MTGNVIAFSWRKPDRRQIRESYSAGNLFDAFGVAPSLVHSWDLHVAAIMCGFKLCVSDEHFPTEPYVLYARRYWPVREISEWALSISEPVPGSLIAFFNIVLMRGTGEDAIATNATYRDAANVLGGLVSNIRSEMLVQSNNPPVGAK